ncbi:hypothetical protein PLCT2_00390 [Planctomycetaceae bacterium]|nr:hypothetical protein PLCT2_00390 [Planctomycetaceae bacterium]
MFYSYNAKTPRRPSRVPMRLLILPVIALTLLMFAFAPVAAPAQGKPNALPAITDFFNLGPIGGKAYPTDAANLGDAKSALTVASVALKRAGAEAGLVAGDMIVGAGKPFEKDAYLELAQAIEAAQATESGALKLSIRRKGAASELSVTLPVYGVATNPGGKPGDAMRDALLKDALQFLAIQQQPDGSFPCTLNAEPGIVVQTSIAGLAFLAAGNTASSGDHARRVEKAAEFVLDNVGVQRQFKTLNGKNSDYTHWSLGFGAIFLAHVFKLTDAKWLNKSSLKGIKSKLNSIRGKIYSGVKESGGFGHGPGGPNLLNYIELEAMSNLLLTALGCIKQCGIDLDAKKLEPMLKFCEACTDAEGSVGYSTTEPQSFIHLPTRSAGLANALAALGLKEHALFSKVTACAKAHFADAFGGHSTPVMGVLAMALVAKREGVLDDFWKAMRHELTMAQSPDGTFAYRPTADTQMLGMNLDRDMNACWTTSHWALILCLEKTGLPLFSPA